MTGLGAQTQSVRTTDEPAKEQLAGLEGLPEIPPFDQVGPVDARALSKTLFARLVLLEEGTHEYAVRAQHPGRAQPRPGEVRRLAVPHPQRADGGHRPGRHDRPDQGDRPVRAEPRGRVPHLRHADDRRRDQALLPGHHLVGARAAPAAGAAAGPGQGRRRAGAAAGPRADRRRAGRAPRPPARRRSSRAWSPATPTPPARWTPSPRRTTPRARSRTGSATRTTASRASRTWSRSSR